MIARKITCALLASLLCWGTARADPVPPVWVSGEPDYTNLVQCGVTYASSLAAAEATFRFNRVPLSSRDDYMHDRALNSYLNIKALPVMIGDAFKGCAMAVDTKLSSVVLTINPVTKKNMPTTIEYCSNSSLIITNEANSQQQVNEDIKEQVNKCVSTFEKIPILRVGGK